jgi:hypothetical protein
MVCFDHKTIMAEFARGDREKTAKETGETFAMNSISYNEQLKVRTEKASWLLLTSRIPWKYSHR